MSDTELVRRNVLVSDDVLAAIDSFEAALRIAQEHGPLESIAAYGTGFALLPDKDKDSLINTPFVVVQWGFNEGDFGIFVSAEIVTKNGDKYILNDGSTGICKQLQGVTASRLAAKRDDTHAFLAVPRGLSKTTYWFNEDTKETRSVKPEGSGKEWKPASTYYLAQ